jgi:hypothetical protein
MQPHLSSPCKAGIPIPEQSFFCASCKKHVHDLRSLDEKELHDLLKANNGGVCGIARLDQVEFSHTLSWPTFSKHFWKGMLASGMLYLQSSSVQAQTPPSTPAIEINAAGKCVNPAYREATNDSLEEKAAPSEQAISYSRKRVYGIRLFRIGMRTFYLNKRFPFFHSRKRHVMGKVNF